MRVFCFEGVGRSFAVKAAKLWKRLWSQLAFASFALRKASLTLDSKVMQI